MRICVITYYFKVGGGTWGTALYTVEVWVLGVGMSTPGAQTALYAEDRGLQVPMALEHGPVTSSGQAAPGPDPRIRHRIQIGMFRPIRLDHTNCLQVAIKTHSFNSFLIICLATSSWRTALSMCREVASHRIAMGRGYCMPPA